MGLMPHRFLNLETCTLKISSEILRILMDKHQISYLELFNEFQKKYPEDVDYELPLSLNFLFLLGKLDYNIEKDMVVFLK